MGVRWTPRAANDRAAQSRREVESHLQLQRNSTYLMVGTIFLNKNNLRGREVGAVVNGCPVDTQSRE